jgi:signal transduction histidine kinase
MTRYAGRLSLLILSVALSTIGRTQPPGFDSLFQRANQYRTNGDYDKALAGYQHCADLARQLKDSLKLGNSLIGIGIVNNQTGNFENGLKYYFEALSLYERIGNRRKEGGTLKNIGNVYRQLKNYDKAGSFLQQALAMQSGEHDSASVGNVLNDIGLVYMDQDSTKKALEYFREVIYIYGRYVRDEVRAFAFNNLALTHSRLDHFREADSCYRSGLALMEKLNNQYGIALILGNFGDLSYRMNDLPAALSYHLRSLAMVRSSRSNELLAGTYDDLVLTYERMGNFKKANEYRKAEMAIKDSVYKEESARSYAEMEAKYQNEKKQRSILLLQRDKELVTLELAVQRRTKYFLWIGILLILVVALSLYRSYAVKRKANRALSLVNKQLEEANRSKTKLFSIISHDLRSPVSSLFNFLQLQRVNPGRLDKEAREVSGKEIIHSAENLLEAMEDLLVWAKSQMEAFSPVMETIDARELLDEMVRLNQPLAEEKEIIVETGATPGLRLRTDPNFIKIILRNLTGNALKFSLPRGRIWLSARQEKGTILFSVRDNGPGIHPEDVKNIFEWNSIRSDSSGLGLKLAREFTEKLDGSLLVRSEPGAGTEFIVSLPQAAM